MYWVDLPNAAEIVDPDACMTYVGTFKSRAAAIAFAKENFGADDNGNICLVSGGPEEGDDE